MRKELDFWKNKVSKLEEECYEKQNEIEELKYILDSKEKMQKCEDVAPSIEWLEDRHQQDCIEISRLNTVIDVLIDKHSRLRQQIGL